MARSDNLTHRVGIGVGITTLVTIFMVLLLTAFSVLTLASARYDYQLSDQAFDSIGAYYQADQAAAGWLAEIQGVVEQTDIGGWKGEIVMLAPGVMIFPYQDGSLVIHKGFYIDDTRWLQIKLSIDADGQIEVVEWLTVPLHGQ